MKAKGGDIQLVGVRVGDKVLLLEYRGTKIVLDNKDSLKFRNGDILGKESLLKWCQMKLPIYFIL